jgi:hypothetical protein
MLITSAAIMPILDAPDALPCVISSATTTGAALLRTAGAEGLEGAAGGA